MAFKNDPICLFCGMVSTLVRSEKTDAVSLHKHTGNICVKIGRLHITFIRQTRETFLYMDGWSASTGGTLLHAIPRVRPVELLIADIEGGRFHVPNYENVPRASEKRLLSLFEM